MPKQLRAAPSTWRAGASSCTATRRHAGEAYEAFIHRTACVPTRDNLHDLFNGLAWLHFPQAKRRLNQLQAAEIARAGVGATRGPLRDALTLFDENGAVLDAPAALWQCARRARLARACSSPSATLWREARLLVFGHALLEKLVSAAQAGHGAYPAGAGRQPSYWPTMPPSRRRSTHRLAAKPFVPLPVLGVPGWWADNTNFCFYDDPFVFSRGPEARELFFDSSWHSAGGPGRICIAVLAPAMASEA